MIRMLMLAAAFAGLAASVPAFYQSNPQAFEAALRKVAGGGSVSPSEARPIEIARAEPAREAPSGRRVRLEADGRGHFVGSFRLNGRSVEALVDTGATLVAINRSTARRIGLHLMPGDFIHEVNTANGRTRAAAAVLDQLEIGGIRVEKVEAVVLDDGALAATLIGMSFLNRLDRFEVRNGLLVMEQ